MTKGKVFTAEQLCLGKMCYLEDYGYEILPGYAHWLAEFKPLWDESKQLFVEPFVPHEPIGVIHISGFDEMRLNRKEQTDFKTTDGKDILKSYRYQGFDGETDQDLDTLPSAA